ncbi:hypothetical protein PCL_04094 [Purpureocillium lilacinum]|uniref:Uncharacterized protein n=1 Tax=Purpureocillium lilacinum TaxID=33203 RepID=A0A2U3EQY0_PURLI|nr:hypothetical protein Purlil1_4781 [Purpureocillium lilacinum]PWI76900.1 hypothetical protein PCL_04094 [Purpureocillium lilacinum]GJN71703.1 hypothetical protein PLICBS_005771 [Purpureocillium lilacinum]
MEEQSSNTASTPLPANAQPASQPASGLSASEPTLRFPRPQGNRRLAKWISTSDPDIMRLTTTAEESGLAESTYELISGTDNESQDGNFTESMDESVGSLDFHRPDDVHSLAGTEYTHDGESVLDDGDAQLSQPSSDRDNETQGYVGQMAAGDDGSMPETDDMQETDSSESDEEARSRCSLEYTQQSLGTPSILTPEASRLVDPAELRSRPREINIEQNDVEEKPNKEFAGLLEMAVHAKDYVLETVATALPGLLFAAAFALLIPILYTPPVEQPQPEVVIMTSTITATTTSYVTTKAPLNAQPTALAKNGMGLMPLGEGLPEDSLFGPKRPLVSLTPQPHSNILLHVAKEVKQTWLSKGCLVATASREENDLINVVLLPVDEGILVKFPKKEAHGVVKLSLKATCRPKMQKVVKVHFGKGILEEALEMTKNLAHDLSGLVPVAAQEAERCIEGAKRSLEAVSDAIGNNVIFVSDNVFSRLGQAFDTAKQSFGSVKTDVVTRVKGAAEEVARNLDTASQQAKEQLHKVQGVQNQLQLGLLDAQISAKTWWLKATGRKEAHEEYKRKAKDFVAMKHAAAKQPRRARRAEAKAEAARRSWSRPMRQGDCQRGARRGRSSTHQCKVVV